MFTAAVIGLGSIGQMYDYENDDGSCILTHAAGFHYHPRFDLIAGVDADPLARARFEKKFNKPAFKTVSDLYARFSPDIISIAVPTALHFSVFKEVILYAPKAILCEKPIALHLDDGIEMKRLAENSGTIVLVNYIRRFEPEVLKLKQLIEQGEFGTIYKGVLWYSKGILNNGSHFIDLCIFLFGRVQEIKLLDNGRALGNDPEPDLKIKFGNVDVYFIAGREECFSVKEFELMGTLGCIKYSQGGEMIITRKTYSNPLFPTYTVLEKEGQTIQTDLKKYQLYVLENLAQSLESGKSTLSNGVTALETLAVVEEILELVKEASTNE